MKKHRQGTEPEEVLFRRDVVSIPRLMIKSQ